MAYRELEINLNRVISRYHNRAIYKFDEYISTVENVATEYLKRIHNYKVIKFENDIMISLIILLLYNVTKTNRNDIISVEGKPQFNIGFNKINVDQFNNLRNHDLKSIVTENYATYKNEVSYSDIINDENFHGILLFLECFKTEHVIPFCIDFFFTLEKKGLPDLFLYNNDKFELCEVKSDKDNVSAYQKRAFELILEKYNCDLVLLHIKDGERIYSDINLDFKTVANLHILQQIFDAEIITADRIYKLFYDKITNHPGFSLFEILSILNVLDNENHVHVINQILNILDTFYEKRWDGLRIKYLKECDFDEHNIKSIASYFKKYRNYDRIVAGVTYSSEEQFINNCHNYHEKYLEIQNTIYKPAIEKEKYDEFKREIQDSVYNIENEPEKATNKYKELITLFEENKYLYIDCTTSYIYCLERISLLLEKKGEYLESILYVQKFFDYKKESEIKTILLKEDGVKLHLLSNSRFSRDSEPTKTQKEIMEKRFKRLISKLEPNF